MKKLICLLSILTFIFFIPIASYAQTGLGGAFGPNSNLNTAASSSGYKIDDTNNINSIMGNVVLIVLGLLGTIFLAFIIYGGVTWMLAEGNEQRVEKAGSIIRQAIIGLIIVVAAYAISYYLINIFGGQLKS